MISFFTTPTLTKMNKSLVNDYILLILAAYINYSFL